MAAITISSTGLRLRKHREALQLKGPLFMRFFVRSVFQTVFLLFLGCLGLVAASHAQTCSIPGRAGTATINAQPNTFFPGMTSPAAGLTSISVGAGTGTNSPISAGDLLLIVQMQGADINTTDSNAYGAGTTAAGVTNTVAFGASGYAGGVSANLVAGNYEWAVATSGVTFAAGGTINLSAPLTNAYFTRASSTTQTRQAFQVIRVPQYANLTLSGGLTVQTWNGSTGGVLVLEATGDINLGGQTITGTGLGFRGAGAVNVAANTTCTTNWNTTGCQQYVSSSSANPGLGGSKGEGIAGTPGRLYNLDPTGAGSGTVLGSVTTPTDGYPGGEASRGAPGNAGGGGNQHNGGGGGGGNGGAGGKGGNTWNSSTNGNAGLLLGGFGGSPSGNTASRWIMGGGGGAGDIGGNGTTSPDGSGGAGGALVILRASRVVGGGTINVNGAPGQRSRATDAGGGGGAGGTVVVAVGSGGLSGALTVNANGGAGGAYQGGTAEQDGPGGGGGGGVLVTNASGTTFNAAGGAAGASNTTSGCAGTSCGATAGAATAGSAGYAITSPGVQVGYECLPNLAVTKATSTPIVTSSTGATAAYTIVVTNTGGAARFVNVLDTALPPGWTLAAAPTYAYNPVTPLAAGRLSSGAETVAIATSSTWAVSATPTAPATGSNSLTWTSFALAPVNAGVPAVVTITFVANIPNTAGVGTYHNGAGVTFLDPTRAAASTRTMSPLTSVNANRTATAYSANTTYNSYAGGTPNVGGSNFDGSQTGPTTEDVQLVPDFSITKTAPATATPGTTFTYTITPRNNGRAIGTQTYTVSQASDVSLANVPSVLGSNPLTVTDTLPAGVTISTAFNGNGWTCTGTAPVVCTLANANAYPIAATTSFAAITGTVTVTAVCSPSIPPLTNTVAVSSPANESITSNNTATAVTAFSCVSTNLGVTKTDAVGTLTAGSTVSYTITVGNTGASANGSVLTDTPSAGLICTAVTCSATGATCPTPGPGAGLLHINNLISPGTGVTLNTLPSGGTMTFSVTCGVTATGLP